MKDRLKIILSLILFISFFSCSEKTKVEEENPILITSITLSTPQVNINLGETYTFNIVDNNGNNVQTNIKIYADNMIVTGHSFTPSNEGTYSIYAKYNEISSNILTLTVTKAPASSITITASQNALKFDQTVNFTVNNNYGDNITSQSEIFVNNNKITGSSYTAAEYGTIEVYATFGQLESSKIILNVNKYLQKVLIEDYTGTWCGWCPRVANAIDLVLAQSDNVVPVTIHASSSSATDPFNFSDRSILFSTFGISGFPTAKINRTQTWQYPENSTSGLNQVINKLTTQAPLGIGISSTLSGNDLSIDVNMEFLYDQTNLKLVVYLVEDKLNATQANYTDLYGGSSSLPNFEHNHVLRHSITDLLGDIISSSASTEGNTYQQLFNFDLSNSDISNSANIHIIAFVVNGSSKTVLNVQEAAVNQTVNF